MDSSTIGLDAVMGFLLARAYHEGQDTRRTPRIEITLGPAILSVGREP